MSKLTFSHSPHISFGETTKSIMLDVIIALTPASIGGAVLFGPRVLLVLAVSVLSAVLSEYLFCKIVKKKNSVNDLSAVVTGLLLGLNLPPTIPVWMAALGSAVAIVIVKQMFGGIGQNFANPAMVGRIVLMLSFTSAMTNWSAPFSWLNPSIANTSAVDVITAPTPLAADIGTYDLKELILGYHGGCIGETMSLLLIAGGIYLVLRKVITPTIPLSFIGTVFALTFIFTGNITLAVSSIFTGGLLLGAIFMATDYATSPVTFKGKIIFGIGCGIITIVIRQFGSLPEGVSFSILIMNILVPHIDNLTRPKPFGWKEG